jgi:hypothetical protein
MFFTAMVVNMFSGKLDFNYPYWALGSADDVKAKEDYTVKL